MSESWQKLFGKLKLEDIELPKYEWRFDKDRAEIRQISPRSYAINFETEEERECAMAMIEFCTKYENESFELFYKWFVKERKEG